MVTAKQIPFLEPKYTKEIGATYAIFLQSQIFHRSIDKEFQGKAFEIGRCLLWSKNSCIPNCGTFWGWRELGEKEKGKVKERVGIAFPLRSCH